MEGIEPSGSWMESRRPHQLIPNRKPGPKGPGFYFLSGSEMLCSTNSLKITPSRSGGSV